MSKQLLFIFLNNLRELFRPYISSTLLDPNDQYILNDFMRKDLSCLEEECIIKSDGDFNVFNDHKADNGINMFQQAFYLIMVLCRDASLGKDPTPFIDPKFIQILSGILLGRNLYTGDVRVCTIISDLFRMIFRLDTKDREYFFGNLRLFQISIRNEDYRRMKGDCIDYIAPKGVINVVKVPLLYPGFCAAEIFKTGIAISKDSDIMSEIERLREKRFILSDADSRDDVLGDTFEGMFEPDFFDGFGAYWELPAEKKEIIILIYRYLDLLEREIEPPTIEL